MCSTSPSASTSSFGPGTDCGATQEPGDTTFMHPSALFPSSLMDGDGRLICAAVSVDGSVRNVAV